MFFFVVVVCCCCCCCCFAVAVAVAVAVVVCCLLFVVCLLLWVTQVKHKVSCACFKATCEVTCTSPPAKVTFNLFSKCIRKCRQCNMFLQLIWVASQAQVLQSSGKNKSL